MILLHLHHNSETVVFDPIVVHIEKEPDLKSNGARESQGGEKWKIRKQK